MRMYARGKVGLTNRLFIGALGALSMLVSVALLTHAVITHATNPYYSSTGKVTASVTASSDFPSTSDSSRCSATGLGGIDGNGNRVAMDGGQHADFTATILNPTIDLGASSSTIYYNLQLDWKSCGVNNSNGNQPGAYSIYSDDFCQVPAGYYGNGGGDGTAHDCLKYVGNPVNYPAYLGCNPGTDGVGGTSQNNHALPCTTSQFRNIQVKDNYPATGAGNTQPPVPESITLNNPDGNNGSNGSRVYTGSTGQVCEYYSYPESNGNSVHSRTSHPAKARCVDLSLTITWTYVANPVPSISLDCNSITGQGIVTFSVNHNMAGQTYYVTSGAQTSPSYSSGTQTFNVSPATATAGAWSATLHYVNIYGTWATLAAPTHAQCIPDIIPYFSVVGGDIAAGTGFGNSCTPTQGAIIKSWNDNGSQDLDTDGVADFRGAGTTTAALATGAITNFVSGLGLSGEPTGGTFGSGSALSFANTTYVNGIDQHGGSFGTLPCVQNFYGTGSATHSVSGSSIDVSTLSVGSSSWTGTTLTLNPTAVATIDAGTNKTITLYVQGNVYIMHDILYSYTSLNTVPRFNLYVQGNIYIAPTVHELHGVYIAQKNGGTGGNIVTCTDSTGTAESYAACKQVAPGVTNQSLLVVGAMAAQGTISLNRTYGSLNGRIQPAANGGPLPVKPAEVVEYTPELWLGGAKDGLDIQSYTSLPPVL